jgi:hypothetical protein
MASEKKIPPHQILVNSLESWATLYNVQGDPYVSGLTTAVSARKNLPMWASLDPLEYLPHAQINSHKRLQLISLIMSVLRNSLVFLPVALTWFAISKATSAFATYTADNSLSVVNFLDFWENGYGVLAEEWALSNVATLDFQIILGIIGLTIAITFLDRSLKNSKNQAMQTADDDRIQMALAISTYLFDQQRVTNVTVNQSLARAIRDILNSTDSLEKTSKELNRTVKLMPNNRDLLTELKNIKTKLFQRDNN